MVSVLKRTRGIEMRNKTAKVKHERRVVTKDRLDMCSHLSMDISVIISSVTATKYTELTVPIISIAEISTGWAISTLGSTKISKGTAAKKGWAMKPVHVSVNANGLRRMWNGILWKVFFHIAAKISAFPTTATGDKRTMMMKLANMARLRAAHSLLLSSRPQGLEKLSEEKQVVLLDMASLCYRKHERFEPQRSFGL